ncbi:hypothetical protein [Rhizobium leguminosarum]|uniref:hypothetical protein n=1 Tax=Rhizobium leguminosarum TaxID=384 RepID=UPI00102FCD80|nr:hypothetical protein [Rhizobium leguminosarum]TAY71258.1 hypothetical protein ELH83_35250 [Rhizobium leguminosarum]TAY71507.1 hypothetical protein ELH83_33360 [Rhizobium leguminosarum]
MSEQDDSESVARFEPVLPGPAPFTKGSVWAKQIALDLIPDPIRKVFEFTFESYDSDGTRAIHEQRIETINRLAPGVFEHVREHGLERRFAGDASLPRSRYWSICKDQTGDDDGNLVFELYNYSSISQSGLIGILDTSLSCVGEFVTNLRGGQMLPENRVFIELLRPVGATSSAVEAFFPNAARSARLMFYVPLRIKQLTFERLVDLRIPQTAAWFASALSGLTWNIQGEYMSPFPSNPPELDNFIDILPCLLDQKPGGGDEAVQVAGHLLRVIGADALIFPSARSSASVRFDQGQIHSHTAWNLVDYTNAEAPHTSVVICGLSSWPTKIVPGAEVGPSIEVNLRTDHSWEWSVRGLRKWNHYSRLRKEIYHLLKDHPNSLVNEWLEVAREEDFTEIISQLAGIKGYESFSGHIVSRKTLVDLAP